MMNAKFVISLDFELFWGVSDTHTIASYASNVRGEWTAIPRMLAMFREQGIRVTWATVGMIMCRDYQQWRETRPSVLPAYARPSTSTYSHEKLVKEHPELFFARSLVDRILSTEGQELGSHTYSHFYCGEPGVTPEQFAADLRCARDIAEEMGTSFQTIVLPRNQIVKEFLNVLPEAGIRVYRGNLQHWLYRSGDAVPGGIAGRAVRFADAFLPVCGSGTVREQHDGSLVNIPASMFLYPWSASYERLLTMRMQRLKRRMTAAARSGTVFHLWWHPHNFGINLEQNLAVLDEVLQHYRFLADKYGMVSTCLSDFAQVGPQAAGQSPYRSLSPRTAAPTLHPRSAR
jgi:peptidoglycan/xylan/chitin deacetylase (PgdA/CDA1 family)